MYKKRPFFIVFEGVEGCGKSYQSQKLKKNLKKKGISSLLTREPGGTRSAESIRTLILKDYFNNGTKEKFDKYTDTLLYLAARNEHIKNKIKPALKKREIVICDRFTDATYAYQGGGRKIDNRIIMQLEKITNVGLTPDFTFLFDAPPEVGLSRAINRGEPDRFEKEEMDFYQRVRSAYLNLAKKDPKHKLLIDATQSIPSIQKILMKQFNLLLSSW